MNVFIQFYVYEFLPVWVSVLHVCATGGQEALDSKELELHMVMSHYVGAGT